MRRASRGFEYHAIPRFLAQAGPDADGQLLLRLIELYDAVPEHQRGLLTWHPTAELRQLANRRFG